MVTAVTAETVTGGHFVLYRDMIGLKAVRHGKDHVNHYFVPLELPANQPMTVSYLDCKAKVQDCHNNFDINLEPLAMSTSIDVGNILVNITGTYIKAYERSKGIISLVYIDLTNGELRRRQERQISAVYRWILTCTGIDPRRESRESESLFA